jgi:phospholipase/carboxylesterase
MEKLSYRVREPAGEAAGALVLLHGRGADEHDLFPLFDILDPSGRLLGLAPRGPLTFPGLPGAHWYEVARLGYPSPATFLPTAATLGDWLDAIPESFGVPIDRTVVGGFSQGAVMSYAMGLHTRRLRPRALMTLSGFIPTVETFDLELSDLDDFPVAIGHGTLDPLIGIEWGRDARTQLESAGASVLYREAEMGHTIDPAFLRLLVPWLEEHT